ncbi:MAG: hypothetical protein KKH34_11935, partial [Candidatus Omnitrophica bacterium]|nr:hypothetical protein [Candidatus Omnitrophota bacterium]
SKQRGQRATFAIRGLTPLDSYNYVYDDAGQLLHEDKKDASNATIYYRDENRRGNRRGRCLIN